MWPNITLDKCITFVESEFHSKTKERPAQEPMRPAITISRMTGAGGHTVASLLAGYLQAHISTHDGWTVFDQNLVDKVLADRHMHKYISDFMEEGHTSMLHDSIEEWMGLHPSSWTVLQRTNATILQLAKIGNVIIVGRGGMIITSKLKNVFHVRLVGSLDKRIARVEEVYGLERKEAANFVKKRDEGRKRYLRDNFDVDADNPLLYHIIINTDMTQYDGAAQLIGEEVMKRFGLAEIRKRI